MAGGPNGIRTDQSIKTRSIRGAVMVALSLGGVNLVRLASNLILTRLLFPEAFGLMALVAVFITGLGMFSDAGISTAIIRNKRGDDPSFLNTAWTVQVIRGVWLWLAACALAYPAAQLYETDLLLQLLPVAGLNALIAGFAPTKVLQANRHLILGRVITLDMTSQILGALAMIALAYMLESVWALVFGGLIGSAIKLALQYRFMPGDNNRFQWEGDAVTELFNFGKFILLSTAVTFVIKQGDKAVLGRFVSLSELGVYNIAFMLATVPLMLVTALNGKIIQPLYRMKPLQASARNRRQVFRARRLAICCALSFVVGLSFAGIWLVDVMYDDRFAQAGPMVVLMCLALIPRMVFLGYGGVLLAVGDSQKFFHMNLATGTTQLALMLAGVYWLGIFGVILAPALATLLVHPLRIFWVRPLKGWDALGDAMFLSLAGGAAAYACWLYWDQIAPLMG